MEDPTSPRKRRRTRSSAVAEEDSPAKRPNLKADLDYPAAIAAAANLQVAENEELAKRQDSEAAVAHQQPTEMEQSEDLRSDRERLDQAHETGLNINSETTQTDTPQEDANDDMDLEGALAAATSAALAGTSHAQNGLHRQAAQPQQQPLQQADYGYVMDNWTDPSLHLRVQSLPILENLSVQILETLAKGSYQETLTIVTQPESAPGQAYATLKSLFDQTKRLYSQHEPFLSAQDLNLRDPEHRSTIRKANLATFVSSVFGSQDVGFYHLNEYFLETFVQDGGRLLKSQGALFLDLKTQAYLSAMANGERTKAEILEDLFPDDLGDRLMSRRPLAKQMTPSEIDFVKRARSRCEHLMMQPDTEEAIAALPDKYVWEDFLRDLSGYVSRSFDDLVAGPTSKALKARQSTYSIRDQLMHHLQQQQQPIEVVPQQPPLDSDDTRIQDLLRAHNQNHTPRDFHQESRQEVVEKAARAAQAALQNDFLAGQHHDEPPPAEHSRLQEPDHSPSEQAAPPLDHMSNGQSQAAASEIPYHTQSAPTQVLYERARLAATAKASPNNRRAGLPSQRRPWTTEEENALMAGLDRVKGPHWSQILAMFGAGGTINESLKDRNQVQLKDKARNLKLFFLKSGIEVPYYLQFVTGELKTRAPSQAAKNEAKERARMRGDEDRAHVEGLLALAGGAHQHDANEGGGGFADESMADEGMTEEASAQDQPHVEAQSAPMQTADADYEHELAQQLQRASRAESEAKHIGADVEVEAEPTSEPAPEPASAVVPQDTPETRVRRSTRASAHTSTS